MLLVSELVLAVCSAALLLNAHLGQPRLWALFVVSATMSAVNGFHRPALEAMTQELVAGMLGVRREGITEAAGHLQREGLITYRRGHITVINRKGIETQVCECYGVLKKELLRLLPEGI